jgi:NADPH-dependent 2,4-dienoyl-CoA reductase/sulfur reductase-like enzyme
MPAAHSIATPIPPPKALTGIPRPSKVRIISFRTGAVGGLADMAVENILIVGGGLAGATAAKTLRAEGFRGSGGPL